MSCVKMLLFFSELEYFSSLQSVRSVSRKRAIRLPKACDPSPQSVYHVLWVSRKRAVFSAINEDGRHVPRSPESVRGRLPKACGC